MLNSLFSFDKNCIIQGLTSELNIFYIYEAYQHFQKNILVVKT